MLRSFYANTITNFLASSKDVVLGVLARNNGVF